MIAQKVFTLEEVATLVMDERRACAKIAADTIVTTGPSFVADNRARHIERTILARGPVETSVEVKAGPLRVVENHNYLRDWREAVDSTP